MAHSMKIKIPVKAMEESVDGEAVAPGVGDEVMLPDVMAMVTAIDGDEMEVEIKSVAGCDCGHEQAEEPEPTEESVRKAAEEADEE